MEPSATGYFEILINLARQLKAFTVNGIKLLEAALGKLAIRSAAR